MSDEEQLDPMQSVIYCNFSQFFFFWRLWGGNEKFAELRAGSLSCLAALPLNFALSASCAVHTCASMWAYLQANCGVYQSSF